MQLQTFSTHRIVNLIILSNYQTQTVKNKIKQQFVMLNFKVNFVPEDMNYAALLAFSRQIIIINK